MTLCQDALDLMRFMTDCERLKREYRHCLLSDGTREDVAAHTWRTTLMAMLLEPYLSNTVNLNRMLRMLVVHDLVEIYAGDVPASQTRDSAQARALKQQSEHRAAERISINAKNAGPALVALWREFEEQVTPEARIAKAIDKLEAQLQHNEAGVSSWDAVEIHMIDDLSKLGCDAPIILSLRDTIVAQAQQLVTAHTKADLGSGRSSQG